MVLFDTDIVSNILKKYPSPKLVKKIADCPPENQFTSAITVGELVYGAYRSNRPEYFLKRLQQEVWPNIKILSFDFACAEIYGRIRADLEQAGIIITEPDLRIASIAICHNLILITGNVRHFSRIPGIKIENWLL